MFRIFDKIENEWMDNEDVALTPDGDIVLIRTGFFGKITLEYSQEDSRYIVHKDVELFDKEDELIYEGDFCESDDGRVGLIYYSTERAAYVFLDVVNQEYLELSDAICSHWLTVVGNVFDTPEYGSSNKDNNDNEESN